MKTCLSVVKREGFFLVIFKRRGLGSGRYNLPGGKLKDDESPEQCAIRETREEVGIDLLNPRVLGKISFIHGNLREEAYVVVSNDFKGIPEETQEALPLWLPYLPEFNVWSDDTVWFDYVTRGQPFECVFNFSEDWDEYYGGVCKVK